MYKSETNEIISDRLLIRPIQNSDIDMIHNYASDKDITMMMYYPKESWSDTQQFVLDAVSKWSQEKPDDREYVIVQDGKVVGGINLEQTETEDVLEIGWIVHRDYKNQGIATKAAKLLIKYAFDYLKVSKIIAHCDSRNSVSEQVMKKLGMKLVCSTGERVYPKTGVVSGEYLYEITRGL